MKIQYWLSIALLLFSAGCRKNLEDTTISKEPVTYVRSALYGTVTGPSGDPLPGVTIRRGPYSHTTDENGYFYFQESPLDEKGVPVHVSAPGFFTITKMVVPHRDKATPLAISLSPRLLRGIWPATEGGTVTIGASSVLFPGGSVLDDQGNSYTGDVRVFATFLNPQFGDPALRMPGDLTGIRKDGRLAGMATFGIIGLELESSTGTPLRLAPGANATLRIGLSGELLTQAPAEIALWRFDASGRWQEQGVATLENGAYVGQVNQFSFWTVALPYDVVHLGGRIVLPDGTPLANIPVRVFLKSDQGALVSDKKFPLMLSGMDGRFVGFVPANTELLISIGSNCSSHTSNLPQSELQSDKDIGDIVVNKVEDAITIQTRLLDCQGDALSPPSYLRLATGSIFQVLPVDQNGSIHATLLKCQSSFLKGVPVDVNHKKSGPARHYSIESAQSLDMGDWLVCDEPKEHVKITLDGHTLVITENLKAWTPATNPLELKISAQSSNPQDSTWLSVNLAADPIHPTNPDLTVNIRILTESNKSIWVGCMDLVSCSELNVQLSQLGQVGEFIIGSIEGTISSHPTTQKSETHTLTTNFVIRRTQ